MKRNNIVLTVLFVLLCGQEASPMSAIFGSGIKNLRAAAVIAGGVVCIGTVLAGTIYHRANKRKLEQEEHCLDSIPACLEQKKESWEQICLLRALESIRSDIGFARGAAAARIKHPKDVFSEPVLEKDPFKVIAALKKKIEEDETTPDDVKTLFQTVEEEIEERDKINWSECVLQLEKITMSSWYQNFVKESDKQLETVPAAIANLEKKVSLIPSKKQALIDDARRKKTKLYCGVAAGFLTSLGLIGYGLYLQPRPTRV